jgi:hypothetical protein
MEPEGSFLHSQMPPPIYAWVSQVVAIPQVSPPKPCIRLSSPPYTLYDPPISFFLILSPEQYWERSWRSGYICIYVCVCVCVCIYIYIFIIKKKQVTMTTEYRPCVSNPWLSRLYYVACCHVCKYVYSVKSTQ